MPAVRNAGQSEKVSKRKGKWFRRLVVVSALLLFLVLPLTLFLLRNTIADQVILTMVQRVEEATGGSLAIGRTELNLRHLSGTVHDVRLEIPSPTGQPLEAEIQSIAASFSLGDLLRLPTGRISARRLELIGPDIRLDRSFLERPATGEEADLAIDVRIGFFEIRDGRFRYEGRELPLAVGVRDLSLEAEWEEGVGALEGELSFSSELTGGPFRSPLPLDLFSRFRQRGTGVDLSGLVVEAPAGIAELADAIISWDGGIRITGTGSVEGNLALFGNLLHEEMPDLAGEIAGDLRLEFHEGELLVHSDVQGYGVQVGPVRTESVSGSASISLDRLTLDRLKGSAFGGVVSGSVQVPWDLDREMRMDLAGGGVDAEKLFELLQLPLPFAAEGDLTFRFVGSWPDRSSWNGSGSVVLHRRSGQGLLPVDSEGEFGIRSGVLQVDAPRVVTSGANLSLTMNADLVRERSSVDEYLRISGTTEDAGLTREGTVRILERFGTELPDILLEPLAGSGAVKAELGLEEQMFLDMTLDLADGVWGRDRYDRLAFRTLMEGDRVRIRGIEVKSEDWALTGDLELDLSGGGIRSAVMTARNFPLERGMELAGIDGDVSGLLSGRVHLNDTGDGPEGDGEFILDGTTIAGMDAGRLEGRFRADDGRFRARDLAVNGPGLEGRLDVSYALKSGKAEINILEARVFPSKLSVWDGSPLPFHAPMDLQGAVHYDGQAFSGEVSFQGAEWDLGGHQLPDLAGKVTLEADRLSARWSSVPGGTLQGRARIFWIEGYPLETELSLNGYRVEFGNVGSGTPVRARLTGTASTQGNLAEPEGITAVGKLDAIDLRIGAHRLSLERPVQLVLDRNMVEAGPVLLQGEDSMLAGRFRMDRMNGRIDADWNGNVSLAVLAAPIPELRARGSMDVDLKLEGTMEDPDLNGTIRFQDGWVRLLGFPQPLEHVRGTIRFTNYEAELSDFSSRFGGGEISGEGGMQFDRFSPGSYYLSLLPVNTRVTYPEGFKGVYEGELLLRGDNEEALINGDLELLRGVYQEPFDIAQILGYGSREYDAEERLMLPVPVAVDLEVSAKDGVWLKNDVANLETALDLHMGGNIVAPEVTGRIAILEGGRIRFRDVEYRIRSGSLDLLDLNKINPYMDITASTTVSRYEITLMIEGTLDRFEYHLSSLPSLSQQDILALLTTGYTLEDLAGSPANASLDLTSDMAASYFAGALTGLFESRLKKVFHLERVRIKPYTVAGSADPTTQLTLGKEVADNLFIIYSTELGGEDRQIYKVDWQVSRKFDLTVESDSEAGVGGGLEFTDRFWLRKRRSRSGETGEESSKQKVVRSVNLPGLPPDEVEKIIGKLPLRIGEPYRRALMLQGVEEIRRSYVRSGRIHVKVDPDVTGYPDVEEVAIVYRVEPGAQYEVRFEGIRKKDEENLRKKLEAIWIESEFIDERFEETEGQVRRYFQEQGHYTVDVVVDNRDGEDGRITIFRIDPGPKTEVASLSFEGNHSIQEERLRKQVLTSTGSTFGKSHLLPDKLEKDLAAIRNLYRDNGYLLIRTPEPRIRLSTEGDRADLVLLVEEGPRFTISGVAFPEECPIEEEQLAEWAGVSTGDLFSPRVLLEAESRLRSALDLEGYPDARVDGSAVLAVDTVEVRFSVTSGPRAIVGDVLIEGNNRTQTKIIRRELTFRRGDPVSRSEILESQHNLYRLGLFSQVKIEYQAVPGTTGEERSLVVHVTELPPIRLRVGAGYSSEFGFRGEIVVTHENVGGYDRSLTVHGRASELQRWAQVLIEEPRLFTRKWPALISILNQRQEEIGFSFRRRSVALRVEHEFRPDWKRFFRYNIQRVDLFDILPGSDDLIQEQKLEDLDLGDIGFAMVRDSRNDPFMTRNGVYVSSEIRLFAPALGSDASFVSFSTRGSYTKSFDGGGTFFTGARLGLAETYGPTQRVPLSERFFAGGARTHRGFARDQLGPFGSNGVPLGGESMLLFTQEWRQPLWGRLRGVVFYDAGNVYLTLNEFEPTDLRHALGIGLHLETPIGPIRVEYGHKLDREEEESRGEYFLSIGQIF